MTSRPLVLAALALVAASSDVAAAPGDAVAGYRSATAAIRAQEKTYWAEFQNRFAEACVVMDEPWQKAHYDEKSPQDRTADYTSFLKLYGDFVALEERLAEAGERLADSGHPEAASVLFADLFDALKRADAAEAEMAGPMKYMILLMFDQRPGVLRHGVARYESRILPAIARCPGAVALLTADGWKRAVKDDGRESVLRRVAVIDALACASDPAATSFLELQAASKSSTMRVAALEALLRRSPSATETLVRLAKDPSPVVRIALFQTLRSASKRDCRWIRPIHDAYAAAKGRLRAEALETLRVLAGRRTGDDPAKWKKWLDENGAAADAGKYEPPAGAAADETTDDAEKPPVATFYGVSATTLAPVYSVPGTFVLRYPADTDVQKTRNSARWPQRVKSAWDDPPPVHQGILCRQLKKSISSLPAGSTFGLCSGRGVAEAVWFEKGAMVRPTPNAAADAVKFAEGLCTNGWCGPYESLLHVMEIAGLDPSPAADDFREMRADTVFLLHTGAPSGGRFVSAAPVVEAFARLNRFRRLVVHTIRICDLEQSDETMRRIAEVSGGTYHTQSKPAAD